MSQIAHSFQGAQIDLLIERFLQPTKTRKTLHLTMITVNGLAHNEYWGMVQSEVVADDLFHE